MIEIMNGRRDGWVGKYVGRAGNGKRGSALANPFPVYTHTVESHTVVVEQYRKWLWEQIKSGTPAAMDELNLLVAEYEQSGRLSLVCWCAPLPCHADVVSKAVLWLIESRK